MAKRKINPPVEVIVLSHNGIENENIKVCLDSLKKAKYSNLKVTVIDRKSTDGTTEYVKKNHPWANAVRDDVANNFSEANNAALKKSTAKYCILLNDDTDQDPNWIAELVKVAEKDESIMALQPKVRSMRQRNMLEYAGAAGGYIDFYGYPICRGRVFDHMEEDKGQYDDVREIFWGCGVALLVRTEKLKQIGYLDEFFENYFEEIDFCWRINSAGYKVLYVPKSVIYHKGSSIWGKKQYQLQKEFYLHRNSLVTLYKNYSLWTLMKILPVRFALDIVTFFSFLFKNPVKSAAVFKSNLWVPYHIIALLKKNRKLSKIKKVNDNKNMRKMIATITPLKYYLSGMKYFTNFLPYIKEY